MSTIINKNKTKCAVFDLDGTLLNTIKTINHYLNLALSSHNLPSVSEADCMSFVGNGAKKLIERALDRVEADRTLFDEVFSTYNEAYNSSPYYLTEPYEGIIDLLDNLRARGIKLAVLSNKPDFATKAAVRHFFGDNFDLVLGGRENIPLKPSPEALHEIMRDLSVTTEQTVYIGDSEVDVITAKNAGIENAIFVTYGFRTKEQLNLAGAAAMVNSAIELLAFINNVDICQLL